MNLNLFGKVKKGLDAIKFVQKLLKAADKLDDDLDGDGKSQLQNICEDFEHLGMDLINAGLGLFREAMNDYGVLKAEFSEAMRKLRELVDHVIKEDK